MYFQTREKASRNKSTNYTIVINLWFELMKHAHFSHCFIYTHNIIFTDLRATVHTYMYIRCEMMLQDFRVMYMGMYYEKKAFHGGACNSFSWMARPLCVLFLFYFLFLRLYFCFLFYTVFFSLFWIIIPFGIK